MTPSATRRATSSCSRWRSGSGASCRDREDEVGPAQDALAPDVARLGGDEFTVIIPGLTHAEDAAKLARRILSGLAHPIRVAGQEIFVNASIGIAIYPDDGEDLETLLMHADTAMYKAKEQGGSSYQAYSRAMNASALQRLTLENALRRALERERVRAALPADRGRPERRAGRRGGAGALAAPGAGPAAAVGVHPARRGERPDRPARRMGAAAGVRPESRLAGGGALPDPRGGEPVEPPAPPEPARDLARILQSTGLESRFLGLELTESLLMHHHKEDTDTLHALRAMGLHLAVDDFGTGYSSFSYLKHLPLDALKIDRSFVREITTSADDAAITTAIIAMAHALGLKVVGEGIETEAQREVLRRQGCDAHAGLPVQPAGPRSRAAAAALAELADSSDGASSADGVRADGVGDAEAGRQVERCAVIGSSARDDGAGPG